jgi:peptide-methionine (R)-S-oxide reductase
MLIQFHQNLSEAQMQTKVQKSKEEWKKILTPEQYYVAREHGTERAGSSSLNHEKREGQFKCVCCDSALFETGAKFESGTGWPSFFKPLNGDAVSEHDDSSWFMRRVEVRCSTCEAHLGHVFNDGPRPTGLRYCMNGVAMKFDAS